MQTEQQNPLATQKVSSLILKFTIPAIISMMVSSLYNIVDQIFIGQGVGMLGNAATNIAFPVNIICTAVALLLGIGSASNFNLKSGAGQTEVAKNYAGNGLTMLVVTHEMAFARDVADHVIFMDDGRIVEQGDPRQVFENPSEERTKQFLSRFHEG